MTPDDQRVRVTFVPRADSPPMVRKRLLIGLAALPLAAWGIFALTYATSRGTEGGDGPFVIVGVTFTCFAGLLIVLASTEGEGEQRAAVASVLATLVILLLAALHAMGWNY